MLNAAAAAYAAQMKAGFGAAVVFLYRRNTVHCYKGWHYIGKAILLTREKSELQHLTSDATSMQLICWTG
eukprot:14086053-Ditylum_brightwellii.AAC.1